MWTSGPVDTQSFSQGFLILDWAGFSSDERVRFVNGKQRMGVRVSIGLESADFSAMGDHIVRFHDSLVASTILYVLFHGS
mmetsp:Transcript_11263/g.16290  ORF Transcript_11263/g.16290 Transcript_11263/m.16290 type:complete len:80 (+) Transcript_11263:74-313(+)